MVKKITKNLLLSLPLILIFFACSSTKPVEVSEQANSNPLQEAYYLNIKGSIQRFVALMSGTFSCYRSSGAELWRVNDGQDSIIVHICTLGVPAKDGYWVYREALMPHLPDVPILQNVYQIEPITRDSLFIHLYDVIDEKKLAGSYKLPQPPLDKSNLEKVNSKGIVLKQEQVSYTSSIISRYSKKHNAWANIYSSYTPDGIFQKTCLWLEPNQTDTSQTNNTTSTYFRRLPNK